MLQVTQRALGGWGAVPHRESLAQEILDECELLRRISQGQAAALLLMQVGHLRSIDELEQAVVRSSQWIKTFAAQLFEKREHNSLAQLLSSLVPGLGEIQRGLFTLVLQARVGRVDALEVRRIHDRLQSVNRATEALLDGTSVEMASLGSGCACEVERLTEVRGS